MAAVRNLGITREQLLTWKHQGMHVADIARLLRINESSVRHIAAKHKVGFSRKLTSPIRNVHPWAVHRPFAIVGEKHYGQLIRMHENQQRRLKRG